MERKWWKEGTVYQIYPRSYADSNGDGIGDLQGIITKLDYLKELGVDIIWLSPVYKSPNDDNGYDISDYQDIMDEFGTMADWEELITAMHERGLKLVMDLVVNHSSDEHRWFVESRKSKDNPYRDYYIWRPACENGQHGQEPNNWVSCFSGSAWELDEQTGEYYLHLFSKKQPDLNWENPQVRREVQDMAKWWLDKGVDGFRMDVINFISKVDGLPNANEQAGGYQWGGEYFMNGPRIHEYLHELHEEVIAKYDAMTVGEMPGVTTDEAALYTDESRREVNMVFQFELMDIDSGPGGKWDVKPWTLKDFKGIMSKWQYGLQGRGWNSLYMSNHDQPRPVSRFGDDKNYRLESAKMLGTLLHTQQGTPYIYQGEEIGMTNVHFKTIEDYQDIETLNMWREKVVQGGADPAQVLAAIHVKGRDNARTPMQWNDSPHAGFTTGTPWLQVNPNYQWINVEQARQDPNSIYHYYRKLIQNRREHLVLVYGDFREILADSDSIYAYVRTLGDERALVILNFFGTPTEFVMPEDINYDRAELLISNYEVDPAENLLRFELRPYEARVYKLTQA